MVHSLMSEHPTIRFRHALSRLGLLLGCVLAVGCATYPTARDLARVQASDSAGRFSATAMPKDRDYERLCGSVIEVEGTVTSVDDSGPVLLMLDDGVLCAFAEDNEESAEAVKPGQRVLVKGIARWDPLRKGWLSPALILPLAP
jgi:hypothetical protein